MIMYSWLHKCFNFTPIINLPRVCCSVFVLSMDKHKWIRMRQALNIMRSQRHFNLIKDSFYVFFLCSVCAL